MLSAAFLQVTPLQAAVTVEADDEALVRVVNYHKSDVRVFVFDSEGARTLLGVVNRGDYRELELDQHLIEQGAVQVKVYPIGGVAGLGAPAEAGNGVKSNKLHLNAGDVVDVWVEPELEATMVRLTRG
ncbi:MAG: hypothetical protein ACR2QM_01590, partial [Longimicrobiales bacterium]